MFWVSLSSAPLGSRSPPHPSWLRRATFPRGEGFGQRTPQPFPPDTNPRLPARPAGGRAVTGVGSQFVRKRRARLPRFQKPEKVGPGRRKLLLPGVLSSISHRRNGGRRQAPPGGRAPRWVKAPTARRVRTAGGLAPGPTPQGSPAPRPTEPPASLPHKRQRPALAGLCLPVGKLETGKGYGQLPRRGRAVAGKRRPSPGPSGPGRQAPDGGGRSPGRPPGSPAGAGRSGAPFGGRRRWAGGRRPWHCPEAGCPGWSGAGPGSPCPRWGRRSPPAAGGSASSGLPRR